MCKKIGIRDMRFGTAIEMANFLLGDTVKIVHNALAYALNN